jgi:hypothetical protein
MGHHIGAPPRREGEIGSILVPVTRHGLPIGHQPSDLSTKMLEHGGRPPSAPAAAATLVGAVVLFIATARKNGYFFTKIMNKN